MSFYRELLARELQIRREKNPRYSSRAFAKLLKIDAGTFSKVTQGKQLPTLKMAEKFALALGLKGESRKKFLRSVESARRSKNLRKLEPNFGKKGDMLLESPRIGSEKFFFEKWYYAAIMELSQTPGFQSAPAWIADQLRISPQEASAAVTELRNAGMLIADGASLRGISPLVFHHSDRADLKTVNTVAIQHLNRCAETLREIAFEDRTLSNMTVAIDPAKLPEAKQMIYDFSIRLCQFLESEDKTRVFHLMINLYPLQTLDTAR